MRPLSGRWAPLTDPHAPLRMRPAQCLGINVASHMQEGCFHFYNMEIVALRHFRH